MSKNKSKIQVSFGHNSENVTGSYTLIDCGELNKKILVDFGMIQENISLLKEYQLNGKRPDFKPKDIDYIFLTHAHIDHSGRLPLLYKWGCKAPVYISENASELIATMLFDSANIMERDAKDLTRKGQKSFEPLCTKEDVEYTIGYLKESVVGEKIHLCDGIDYQMNWNAHIFKSVSITFWIKNGSQTRKIIVTGDIGNLTVSQKFVEEFIPFESCNLLIGEATYADKKRNINISDHKKDLERIEAGVRTTCIDRKGSILIPTFAFGRTPTIIATLYDIFHEDKDFNIPIICASPLALKLIKIFEKELPDKQKQYFHEVLSWGNLKLINNFEELEGEMKEGKPKIYCCPSGMMTAGYSVYVGSQLIPHSNNMIIFCGYNSEGSLARKIKEGKTKTISIDGKSIHNRCQVISLKSFSSHAQHEDLLNIYSGKQGQSYDKIALIHSNQKEKIEFAKELEEEIAKRNHTSKVVCVNKSTVISL